ncbi:MAG: FMN-binding negative transcriptional regulator [Pseudomonadota bacterium]
MHVPQTFRETDGSRHRALIHQHPLATLITAGSPYPDANHIPMVLAAERTPAADLSGSRLLAHVPRVSPLVEQAHAGVAALAVFQGPDAYVTPSWYADKSIHGKVVPTWNYAVVHLTGTLKSIDDPGWVLDQLNLLTAQQEAARDAPWAVSDAPAEFTRRMVQGLVGLELVVDTCVGKWKVSQNKDQTDQQRVAIELGSSSKPAEQALGALMRERLQPSSP